MKLCKLSFDPLSGFHDLGRSLFEIRFILYRFHSQHLCSSVHGIGVDGKFHIIQIPDQFFPADCKADAHSRHRAGLGKGLHDQQIVVPIQKRQTTLAAKIYVCLIHDHHHIPVGGQNLFHHLQRLLHTGGCVGVWKYNAAVILSVILRSDPEILIQRTGTVGYAVDRRPHIIKGICHIREQDGLP